MSPIDRAPRRAGVPDEGELAQRDRDRRLADLRSRADELAEAELEAEEARRRELGGFGGVDLGGRPDPGALVDARRRAAPHGDPYRRPTIADLGETGENVPDRYRLP